MESKNQVCYTNNCDKHVPWSYGYKSLCNDDKFSKPFKSYLGEFVDKVMNSMFKECKYYSCVMKQNFDKELMLTKKMIKVLKTLLSVGFVIIVKLMSMLK